nr:immunoglobulin heavy chain junction region [Macaca mulatta]
CARRTTIEPHQGSLDVW